MAKRPGPITKKQSSGERGMQNILEGGKGNEYAKFIDPLGIGDAFFGGTPQEQDYSELDAENDQIIGDLQGSIPNSYASQEYAGDFDPTILRQGESGMSGISTDPKLRQYQLAALQDLENRSSEGLTAQDRMNIQRTTNDVNAQNAGRVGAIRSNMAERGMSGSGQELVAQMMGAQAATNRQADQAMETAAQSQNAQRAAAQSLGSLSGQMRGQEFGEQSDKARANDDINRFNVNNAMSAQNQAGMRNMNTRQQVASNNATGKNAFGQQQFGNRATVTNMRYNDNANKINESKQDYQNSVNAQAKKKSDIFDTVGKGAMAAGMMFSDEDKKKDITHLSDDEIEEFLDSLQPKRFRYKDEENGKGDRMGVMAQDMERSEMGRDIVKDHGQGKELDVGNVIGALLDAVALLNRKVG